MIKGILGAIEQSVFVLNVRVSSQKGVFDISLVVVFMLSS